MPTCSGRSARWRASAGSASPAHTPRTCVPRRSRPWPRPARVQPPPPPVAGRKRPHPDGHAAGLHGRALPGATGRRSGRHTRPGRDHRLDRGLPRRVRAGLRVTLEVAAEAEYDSAYTFIFSPRPGTRAAGMRIGSSPRTWWPSASSACGWWWSGRRLAKHRARIGQVEDVLVEGPSKRDPSVTTGRTGQNKLVHFAPVAHLPVAAGSYATVRVTGAAPHHLAGDLVDVIGRPRHRTRIPVAAG